MKRIIGLALALTATMALGANTPVAASEREEFSLNVVHGIPGVTVDVCVNGAKAITDFQPGDVVSDVRLREGEYRLKVTPAGEPCSAAILQARAELEGGRYRSYTVVANLDDDGTPNLLLLRNPTRVTAAGSARLVIRHTADAPPVTVWADGSKLNRGRGFEWGETRRYPVPAGTYSVAVSPAGSTTPVIGPTELAVRAGFSYQLYAWGNSDAGYALAIVATRVGQAH